MATGHIPHTSKEDDAAVRMRIDGIAQIITDKGTIGHFLVTVGNINIPIDQYIDRPGIRTTMLPPAFRLSLGLDHICEVRS